MRIIGIDPGMAIAGYCVLDVTSNDDDQQYSIVASGSIQTDKNLDSGSRLLEIHQDLIHLIKEYKPDVASVEQIFYFRNAKTIMPVSEARGVIIMSFRMFDIPVYEYTPLVIKQTITGYGRADKEEISRMVKVILDCESIPKLDDTADAIAIALCHARQQNIIYFNN